ncbi:MAG: enoyl-CoA hydratase-related protein [Pseudomonadota bacterium]
MSEQLLYEVNEGVATITLNRPDARNALSMEMRGHIVDAMMQSAALRSVRCVVLKGSGDHFMAGGDVKTFQTLRESMSADEIEDYFQRRVSTIAPLIAQMREMEKPVMACVQGAAAGFGFSLALACDLILAREDASFIQSYTRIGASMDGGSSYHLPRLVGTKLAMEIAMLAEPIGAQRALQLGLINRVFSTDEFEDSCAAIAARLATLPTRALAACKSLLYASLDNDFNEQMAAEARHFGACAATEDWAEGVRAFTEKRTPQFTGR